MLDDGSIGVRLKLAGIWAAVMFVYVYVDVIGFYKPGVIEDILVGKVWEFEISQMWAVAALALMIVPSLMVFLSVALPARGSRWTNLIVASLYVPVSIFNVLGESWVFYYWLPAIVEAALLVLAIRYVWKWPVMDKVRPA